MDFNRIIREGNDEACSTLTGLDVQQFSDLLSRLGLKARGRWAPKGAAGALGVFLVKLKIGLSHRELGVLFEVPERAIDSRAIATRQALTTKFVPKFVGVQLLTREDVMLKHTTALARAILGPGAIFIMDGTYIYSWKSSNYSFARRTYSEYKCRHLVKPMIVGATDGYIVDIFGPYLGGEILARQHPQPKH